MEDGALQVALDAKIGGGVRWFREGSKRNRLGTGGEVLPLMPFGLDELDGHFCRECKLLVLQWPNSSENAEKDGEPSPLGPFSIRS